MKLVSGDRVTVIHDHITPSHLGREGTVLMVDKNRRRPIRVRLEVGLLTMDLDYQRHELRKITRWQKPHTGRYNSKVISRFLTPWRVPTVGNCVGILPRVLVCMQHQSKRLLYTVGRILPGFIRSCGSITNFRAHMSRIVSWPYSSVK